MTKEKIIVGIDPDIERNGIGYVSIMREGGKEPNIEVGLCALPFAQALDYIAGLDENAGDRDVSLRVFVEAGWMERKSNHHAAQGRRAEKISKDVGANHQTGRLLIEMLQHQGITAEPVHPLRKCWKGRDRKITHDELQRVTGNRLPKNRTNQEERDALLLAWAFAELPIRC